MKKYLLLVCTLMIITSFVSCGETPEDNSSMSENSVLEVITEASTEPETTTQDETTEQVTEAETTQPETEETTIELDSTESEPESIPEETTEEIEEEPENNNSGTEKGISGESFVEDVKSALQHLFVTESITDIVYQDRKLTVYVDLSQTDPTPLTLQDLALHHNSSITDDILELSQYDDLWDEVIIDFGEIGTVVNTKADIVYNGYGGRYFDVDMKYLDLWGMVP